MSLRDFALAVAPPPLKLKPEEWLNHTDTDKNGVISQEEVIVSLCASLRPKNWYDRSYIRDKVQDLWATYDTNNDILIKKQDILDKGMLEGLIQIEDEFKKLHGEKEDNSLSRGDSRRATAGPPPSLSENPREWFSHYDVDNSDSLSFEEIIHGLVESCDIKTEAEKEYIRTTLESMWQVFDNDGNGSIDRWEFTMHGGMGDALKLMEEMARDPKMKEKKEDEKPRRVALDMPPVLSEDPAVWFDHFDIDNSKSLTQREVIHGLYVTLNAVEKDKRVAIRKHVVKVWKKQDMDRSGTIEKEEFLGLDGLACDLITFEFEWKEMYPNDGVKMSSEEGRKIKVYVPRLMKFGDTIKVSSPISQEHVIVMIPEKARWIRDDKNRPFFFVNF